MPASQSLPASSDEQLSSSYIGMSELSDRHMDRIRAVHEANVCEWMVENQLHSSLPRPGRQTLADRIDTALIVTPEGIL